MRRKSIQVEINGQPHSAEVRDGEVIGWKSLTLSDLEDILGCMAFLMQIEYAVRQTGEEE